VRKAVEEETERGGHRSFLQSTTDTTFILDHAPRPLDADPACPGCLGRIPWTPNLIRRAVIC